MKRTYFVFFVVVSMPFLLGWNWDTHQAFVDAVYYSVDGGVRVRLNLTMMEYGSIVPDKEFKDFQRHGFPKSLAEAEKWMKKAREAWEQGDNHSASLAFGIASHYITDTFAAPHSISGEPYYLHRAYENQGSAAYQYVACRKQDVELGDVLYTGSQEGLNWEMWTETRDARFPQAAVHDAAFYLLPLALDVFNSSCTSFETVAEMEKSRLGWKSIAALVVVFAVLLLTVVSLIHDLR